MADETSTGIYTTTSRPKIGRLSHFRKDGSSRKLTKQEQKQLNEVLLPDLLELAKESAACNDINAILANIEATAVAVLEGNGFNLELLFAFDPDSTMVISQYDENNPKEFRDFNEKKNREHERLDSCSPETGCKEAAAVVEKVRQCRRGLTSGDIAAIAVSAFWVGRYAERMDVRPHEPNALTGSKIRKAVSTGGKVRNKGFRNKELDAKAEYSKIRADHPKMKHTRICEKLAIQFGVGVSTIKRWMTSEK